MAKTVLLLIPLVLGLTGCGMRGDLYLPADPAATTPVPTSPVPPAEPAAPVVPTPGPADEDETRKPGAPPGATTPAGN